jgi:spectinomycin phosphotransferase/16S rRNA (guanine(1405)-N(7))-methyltransferase
VLTPPDGLSEDALVRVLGDGWGLAVASIDYLAVGFGSHHWDVVDTEGARRFVTVDDLDLKRQRADESEAAAFGRLQAALATARDLRDSGATFVIAPIPTVGGTALVQMGKRFGVALYPYVEGEAYSWGEFSTPAHRRAVLDLIVAVHTTPTSALRHAMADDFAVPHRDDLELTDDPNDVFCEAGPYTTRTSTLLVENSDNLERLLVRYDDLVEQSRRQSNRMVLTHGEPHPGNTMLTSDGWVLVDWDTVLLAPPERDLWSLDPGDGSILAAYADATGTVPRPLLLELYGVRWDLADIALSVSEFRRPHVDSPDSAKSWEILSSLIEQLPA